MAVSTLVIHIVQSYNVNNTMNEMQIVNTAWAIIRDYWHLKIEDLKLFADQAINGKFGKVYNQLDQATIMEWMRMYEVERAEVCKRVDSNRAKYDPADIVKALREKGVVKDQKPQKKLDPNKLQKIRLKGAPLDENDNKTDQ